MENKKPIDIEKAKQEKSELKFRNNKIPIIPLIVLFIAIFILIIVLVSQEDNVPSPGSIAYFSDCQVLSESCLTEECKYYFLCSAESGISNCKVYDCNSDYGILIEKQGKTTTSKRAKPNPEETQKIVQNCQGEIEVLTKECKDNSLNISLKVKTAGECKINAFLADLGDGNYTQPSWEEKAGSFEVKVKDNCNVAEVIAIGTGGVAIKKSLQ